MKAHKPSTNLLSITFSIVAIVAVAYILISTSLHSSTTISYLLSIAILAVILSYLVCLVCNVGSDNALHYSYSTTTIFIALMYAILLRIVYILRTHALVEPLYDGYKDLIVSYIYYKNHKAFIISNPKALTYSSSFPLLKILTVIYAYVSNLPLLFSALSLSTLVGILMILVMYLLARIIARELNISGIGFKIIALILASIWPELIYYSLVYYSRHYSLILYYIFIFIVLTRNHRFSVELILILLSLPFSYSLFPPMIVILIAIVAIEATILKVTTKTRLTKTLKGFSSNLRLKYLFYILACALVGVAGYMLYFAPQEIVIERNWVLKSLSKVLFNIWSRPPFVERYLQVHYYIPKILLSSQQYIPFLATPFGPVNVLVLLRDSLLYLMVVIGLAIFLYLTIKRQAKTDE